MPPHLTISLIASAASPPPPLLMTLVASLCDSILLKAQSPNPLEILSKKSPEKLLLPQPTDLDLNTFLPNDEPPPPPIPFVGVSETTLLGLSSSSSTITSMPPPPPTLMEEIRFAEEDEEEEEEDEEEAASMFFFFLARRNGRLLLLVESLPLLADERDRAREVVEGVKDLGEEEERWLGLGTGKEEVTSLPSFSWRHKAQIPPGFFV
ncbi:unknown protein [Arabidopsis thaliana]|nr:unknown protein [Arabidopsis thaliana]